MANHELWRLFWAKTNRDSADGLPTRPLWAHLLDVANAAELLWEIFLPASLRAQLANAMTLSERDAGHMLALWIGLHDLGKAIPSFQHQHAHSKTILSKAGLKFPAAFGTHNSVHHGHASISLLYLWLKSRNDFEFELKALMESMAAFVGFHHGKLWQRTKWRDGSRASNGPLGDSGWRDPQLALADALINAWQPVWPLPQSIPTAWPPWLLGFAGWVTLADWIGSMAEHYPEVDAADDLASYLPISRAAAATAIKHAGLDLRASLTAPDFLDLFGDGGQKITQPRPLQQQVVELPLPVSGTPTLTIVEAPTGEGKTEAAFYLAARQQVRAFGGGVYIAMPTQATSNGLFDRFKRFLEKAHDHKAGAINLLLVHGNSLLHPDQEALLDQAGRREEWENIYSSDVGEPRSRALTASWFLPKKRSLLAPYGVGTVDQALLATLFSKHFFLRLFGLAGKTIIFDEVHAYDLYMSQLFQRLLAWLRELGCDVILLSATLPSTMRRSFLQAWGIAEGDTEGDAPYPVVWSAIEGRCTSATFAASQHQQADLSWMNHEPEAVADMVVEAIGWGAAVAVIVNTVARAQTIFETIRQRLSPTLRDEDLLLFHARFPFALRLEIEARVHSRFGPDRPSQTSAVLVATQVAEQSLDLDVDLMLSDLAPVDLLLQRAGRLHRHAHHVRPDEYRQPQLVLLSADAAADDLPDIGEIGGGSVYDALVMWKSWRLLRRRERWNLPDDYRSLIEGVYGDETDAEPEGLSESAIEKWRKACDAGENSRRKEVNEAERRLIQQPHKLDEMVCFDKPQLADEDEERVHQQLQALTRLGEPSVEVICLHEGHDGRLYLDREYSLPAPLTPPLRRNEIKALQNNSLRLSSQAIVHHLFKQNEPRWTRVAEETPAIMRHRLLVFRDGWWRELDRYHIEFDMTLGLIIHRLEG